MNYLIDTSKALNELLERQFQLLKDNGEIPNSVKYGDWLAFKNFIIEPVISKSIKEIVFDYITRLDKYKHIRIKYPTVDKVITDADERDAIYIKQLSIYFYRVTFNDRPYLSTSDIGILHKTTKQNVSKTIDTVQDWADVQPDTKEHITAIGNLIAEAKNNNNLKIS